MCVHLGLGRVTSDPSAGQEASLKQRVESLGPESGEARRCLDEVMAQLETTKGQLAASEAAKESLRLELEGKSVAMETQLQRYS